jgi:hypothetical protein
MMEKQIMMENETSFEIFGECFIIRQRVDELCYSIIVNFVVIDLKVKMENTLNYGMGFHPMPIFIFNTCC